MLHGRDESATTACLLVQAPERKADQEIHRWEYHSWVLGKVDAFGQAFFFESPAYGIIIGIDELFETVGQPQDEQDGGIVSQGYAGVTLLDTPQC